MRGFSEVVRGDLVLSGCDLWDLWDLGLGLIVLLIGGQDGRMGGVGGFVWVRQGRVAVLEVLFENDHLFGRMVMVV